MKVLVTGARGMLAHDLIPLLRKTHKVVAFSREDLDITERASVFGRIKKEAPGIVINCAAYTKVDKAEEEREKAFLVNGLGVQNLAMICHNMDIPLCHISTDYVFDGRKDRPYTPFDATNPVNTYGESKLAGERYIQWLMNSFYIIRTSWLYGRGGSNFVSTIVSLAKQKKEIRVVKDQKGSPTSTVSLSLAILDLIGSGAFGIYHFTDGTEGGISWFDFAKEIIRLTGYKTRVIPIVTDQLPRPAKRPANSVLDTAVFSMVTGRKPTDWKEALRGHLS